MSIAAESFSEVAQSADASAGEPQTVKLCWYGSVIGTAEIVGDKVRWAGFASERMEKLFKDILPVRESDNMPQSLVNIGPENEIFPSLGIDNQADYLLSGLRFLSNIVISPNAPYDLPVENDYLHVDFDDFIDNEGVFNGYFAAKPPSTIEEDALMEELSHYWKNRYQPRFSGKEMKLPVTLQEDGSIIAAESTAFTHFLKLPNAGLKEGWGVNEWMCMQLSEAAGLPTAKHALVKISDDLPPAYLAERFDINHESRKGVIRRLLQDFCTLAGMRPLIGLQATNKEGLAAGTLEQVAKTMKQYSTDPVTDSENLFKRALVSLAVGDCDMHRKNISMLFRFEEKGGKLASATMSPAYDVTSEIYTHEQDLDMTLGMGGGKRNKLNRKALMLCAKNIGIPEERATEIIDETFTKIAARAVEMSNNLPEIVTENRICHHTANRITTIAVMRAQSMGLETPEWEPVERLKLNKKGYDPEYFQPDASTFPIAQP